jgi:hypothetical protein
LARVRRRIFSVAALVDSAYANPYAAKPGERSVNVRIATSAVSGGFAVPLRF